MTEPPVDPRDVETRPISVAELLAKNGTIGAPPPVTGRRRRKRGNADAVTVAELTGEIPVIRVDDDSSGPATAAKAAPISDSTDNPDRSEDSGSQSGGLRLGSAPGFIPDERPSRPATGPRPVERESRPVTGPRPVERRGPQRPERPERRRPADPRWPKSDPQPAHNDGPQQSPYPRPMRRAQAANSEEASASAAPTSGSGAERMRPDPLDTYTDIEVDVMDTDVRAAETLTEDSAYVRSILTKPGSGRSVRDDTYADADGDGGLDRADGFHDDDFEGDFAAGSDDADDALDDDSAETVGRAGVLGALLVVLQSMVAVAVGAGLFVAFDQLWRWNSIVALVLTGLVTLGMVGAVYAVRKTPDIVSTLIAVAVALLVTLGPMVLQAG